MICRIWLAAAPWSARLLARRLRSANTLCCPGLPGFRPRPRGRARRDQGDAVGASYDRGLGRAQRQDVAPLDLARPRGRREDGAPAGVAATGCHEGCRCPAGGTAIPPTVASTRRPGAERGVRSIRRRAEDLRRRHAGRARLQSGRGARRVPDPARPVRLGQDHLPDDARGLRGRDPGRDHPRRPADQQRPGATGATSAWCSRTTRCSRT